MGRKPDDIRAHFIQCRADNSFKTLRAKCKFCGETVSNTPKNMQTHHGNCKSVPRSIGRLPADGGASRSMSSLQSNISKSTPKSSSDCSTLSHMIVQTLSSQSTKELDLKFSKAVHATATPFNFFTHKLWIDFFSSVSKWKVPSPQRLGGELLDTVYKDVMEKVVDEIKRTGGGTLSIDGATDNLAKSKSNVILHTPRPLFIEYLRSDLKKETTPNVVAKLTESIRSLDQTVGMKCVSNFVSDSCNGMRDVRKKLQEKNLVRWSYGCAAHALNNFTEDIAKLLFRNLIKKCVFAVKSIKNTSMVRKLFDRLCCEKFNRTFSLPLYSKTRWSSINFMMRRLIQVRSVISYLPHALLHERSKYGIDPSYELPKALTDVLVDAEMWKELEAAHDIFNLICQCIGELESDNATMSTAYALFLTVRMHIHDHVKISEANKRKFDASLLRQWSRIYSPVHSLAFRCDPFYNDLRSHVDHKYPQGFVNLGFNLTGECHKALKLIQDDDKHGDDMLHEFMNMSVNPSPLLDTLRDWAPGMVWGQVQSDYPTMSRALYNVFRAPASTAGVERNHKVNKRVLNPTRCRLSEDRVEKQVSVAHNLAHLEREQARKRSKFEIFIARERFVQGSDDSVASCAAKVQHSEHQSLANTSVAHAAADGNSFSVLSQLEIDELEPIVTAEEVELEHNVWDFTDPTMIFDSLLFNIDEDDLA